MRRSLSLIDGQRRLGEQAADVGEHLELLVLIGRHQVVERVDPREQALLVGLAGVGGAQPLGHLARPVARRQRDHRAARDPAAEGAIDGGVPARGLAHRRAARAQVVEVPLERPAGEVPRRAERRADQHHRGHPDDDRPPARNQRRQPTSQPCRRPAAAETVPLQHRQRGGQDQEGRRPAAEDPHAADHAEVAEAAELRRQQRRVRHRRRQRRRQRPAEAPLHRRAERDGRIAGRPSAPRSSAPAG